MRQRKFFTLKIGLKEPAPKLDDGLAPPTVKWNHISQLISTYSVHDIILTFQYYNNHTHSLNNGYVKNYSNCDNSISKYVRIIKFYSRDRTKGFIGAGKKFDNGRDTGLLREKFYSSGTTWLFYYAYFSYITVLNSIWNFTIQYKHKPRANNVMQIKLCT